MRHRIDEIKSAKPAPHQRHPHLHVLRAELALPLISRPNEERSSRRKPPDLLQAEHF